MTVTRLWIGRSRGVCFILCELQKWLIAVIPLLEKIRLKNGPSEANGLYVKSVFIFW